MEKGMGARLANEKFIIDKRGEVKAELKCAKNNVEFVIEKYDTAKAEQIASFLESAKRQIESALRMTYQYLGD